MYWSTEVISLFFLVVVVATQPSQQQVEVADLTKGLTPLLKQGGHTPGLPNFLEAGKCSDVGVKENFDYSKYSGKWYMGYKIDNPFLGDMYRCIESDYRYMGPGFKGFKVKTTGRTKSFKDIEQIGEIRSTKEFEDASMSIFFPDSFPANYQIIDTDYSSYSCVYSCTSTSNFKSEFGFVFARKPEDAHQAWMKCASSFTLRGINFAKLKPTDMSCYTRKPFNYNISWK